MNYVTVFPATKNRNGWMVSARLTKSLIQQTRLEAPTAKPEEARAEAQRMYPDRLVVMPDDKEKPWN